MCIESTIIHASLQRFIMGILHRFAHGFSTHIALNAKLGKMLMVKSG